MTVNEELRNRLRALVPTLSESTFDNADVPLRSALSHTEYQATVLAIQRLGPHVDRSAIEDGATWRDVAAWIANGQADPEVAPLPPRGYPAWPPFAPTEPPPGADRQPRQPDPRWSRLASNPP